MTDSRFEKGCAGQGHLCGKQRLFIHYSHVSIYRAYGNVAFFHTPSVANGDHQETGICVILILSLIYIIF